MTEYNLSEIRAFLHDNFGFEFAPNRDKELHSKLTTAAKAFQISDTEEFINWLLKQQFSADLSKKLAEYLTVGETYFFREKTALDYLENEYLPYLVNTKNKDSKRLKIWCAGCSSGEEPYSIAIIVNRFFQKLDGWTIKLIASDINPLAINKAKTGIYTKWSFRNTSADLQKTYFDETPDGKYQIKSWLRNSVDFRFLNLMNDPFPNLIGGMNDFDVIFCRNVFIYFSQDAIKAVSSKFYKSLKEDGILAVSPVEASSVMSSEFNFFSHQGTTLFRKSSSSPKKNNGSLFTHNKIANNTPIKKIANHQSLLTNKNTGKAPEKPRREIQPEKEDKPLTIEAAMENANLGELEKAKQICLAIINKNKTNYNAYFLLANIYFEQGLKNEASWAFSQSIFLKPQLVMAHFLLGELNRNTHFKEAQKHYSNALKELETLPSDAILEESDGIKAGELKYLIQDIING